MAEDPNTADIKDWRSIVTLTVFLLANAAVLFPFQLPVYVPRLCSNWFLESMATWRIIHPRGDQDHLASGAGKSSRFVLYRKSISYSTASFLADLFLIAILAIGRQEVYDGTAGADHVNPIDNMIFLITMSYIGLSIEASGLVRILAFKAALRGSKSGIRLFYYVYTLFFVLGSISGNDPLVDTGTAFLAYMTRISSNIEHRRVWTYTLFAIANIASALLVSSSSTNVVLAGAFKIKFATYTANMALPVIGTAVLLFPFLAFVLSADSTLIPSFLNMNELSAEEKLRPHF